MNPEHSNGGLAVALIQESFAEIKLQHPAVLADQDPEPLHRMRVCFRRLRSTVVQFAPALELPASVHQQAMARIGRRLGLARDLDVLRHRLHDQLLPSIPDPEQQRLKGVFKQLRRERKFAFAELTDTLNSRRYLRLLADLKPWLQQPRFTPLGEQALRDWLPEWKASVLCGLLSHPGWFVPALEARGAAEQLHGLRKAIKRARYGLANLEGVEGAGVSGWITTFKGLQQHLGDLNDFDVLERAIANLLDGDPADRLPVFSAALSSLRQQSWTVWLDEASRIRSHGGRRALYELLLPGRSA